MQLNKENLENLDSALAELPPASVYNLPEKVLQFGTGVLLRGLPDYFIDKANKQGLFNGRVVVVKSTAQGDTQAFDQQDGMYTLLEQGFANGQRSEKVVVNAAISKVLTATTQWEEILAYAKEPEMKVIISNTTEVGITLVEADATAAMPVSFPGRLLAFLKKRYEHFEGSEDAGMVIVPTELITDNGARLQEIVVHLARMGGAGTDFLQWLNNANDFCNSLVDRIVPGKPSAYVQQEWEEKLGYKDALMIMSETYRLWAIETSKERTAQILSFAHADTGVVITSNINKFRELKLRLLNGTHTFSCGLARLAGMSTVKEAMQEEVFRSFVSSLMLQGIVPAITGNAIPADDAKAFSLSVIDRFTNPYIEHLWVHICVQYSSKMAMRNQPLITRALQSKDCDWELMALGTAAYLLYYKPSTEGHTKVNAWGDTWNDDKWEEVARAWQHTTSSAEVVDKALTNKQLWGNDTWYTPAFRDKVCDYLEQLMEQPAFLVMAGAVKQKTVA